MRIECEICGAYTEDPNEIEWAKKYRTCPECKHIGSLFIAEEDKNMAKTIRYNVTFLGTIELDDNDNPNHQQVMDMIADDFNQWGSDIGYANDVEYEIEGEEEDKDWLEKQAEIVEYERIAENNPYIFKEDEV
jgi:hypothetical protein